MKTECFVCDSCHAEYDGDAFAHDLRATVWVGRQRFDLKYPDCCEGCALAFSHGAVTALQAINPTEKPKVKH